METKIENADKTQKISKDFKSTEEFINSNLEIEEKLTSASLLDFYLQTIQNQNELMTQKSNIKEDYDKISNFLNDVKDTIGTLTTTIDKQKEENKYKETIDGMKESFDELKRFGNKLVKKLNAVTISPKNNLIENKKKNNFLEEEETEGGDFFLYILAFFIVIMIISSIYFFFFR